MCGLDRCHHITHKWCKACKKSSCVCAAACSPQAGVDARTHSSAGQLSFRRAQPLAVRQPQGPCCPAQQRPSACCRLLGATSQLCLQCVGAALTSGSHANTPGAQWSSLAALHQTFAAACSAGTPAFSPATPVGRPLRKRCSLGAENVLHHAPVHSVTRLCQGRQFAAAQAPAQGAEVLARLVQVAGPRYGDGALLHAPVQRHLHEMQHAPSGRHATADGCRERWHGAAGFKGRPRVEGCLQSQGLPCRPT